MPLTQLDINDIYKEVADLAIENGIANQETWNELVDEVVEGYIDLGEMDDDQNTEGIKATLSHRWHDFHLQASTQDTGLHEEVVERDRTVPIDVFEKDGDEFENVEDLNDTLRREDEGF